VLQRRGRAGDQAVEQRVQADAGLRADRDDRVEVAPGDRLLQVRDQHVRPDRLAAEVAVHQRLVLALRDDPLDQLVPVLLDRRQVLRIGLTDLRRIPLGIVQDAQRDQAEQAGDRLAVVGQHRLVDRHHVVAEGGLAVGQGLVVVGARVVQPGDRDGARHAHRGTLLPQTDRGRVDAFRAVDRRHDEERGVRGPQAGAQLTDEVGVAGGVQQVDLDAVVQHRRAGQRDRALLPDRRRIVVGDRGALGHRTCPGDRRGGRQQRLHQRRLPRTGVAHQHHVANPAGFGHHRRCGAGDPLLRSLLRHGGRTSFSGIRRCR
jgi:hypothetical protein